MTIYDIQNSQKTPIWKQRIIECRSSGLSVKEWCKERGLDFTTYYRWERKILTSIIPAEDVPGLPGPNLPSVSAPQNSIVSNRSITHTCQLFSSHETMCPTDSNRIQ